MIAVIGVGQSLRGDDAAGLEAVLRWQQDYPDVALSSDLRVHLVEQPGLDLLPLFDGASAALLVDAMQSDAEPGSVRVFGPDALENIQANTQSQHGWGIGEVLELAATLKSGDALPTIRIVGIEARSFELGADLSAPVRRAVPHAGQAINRELDSLRLTA